MKSKGAPGLAFETWDPSNLSRRAVDQFPLETLTLLFVIRSEADLSRRAVEGSAVLRTFRGNVFDRSVAQWRDLHPNNQNMTHP